MAFLTQQQAIIPAAAALSAPVALGEMALHGVLMPSSWTAADLTFQVTIDGVNYYELYDAFGNEITIVASSSRYIPLDPTIWRAINGVIVRSGSLLAPVNQLAQAIIVLMTRVIF